MKLIFYKLFNFIHLLDISYISKLSNEFAMQLCNYLEKRKEILLSPKQERKKIHTVSKEYLQMQERIGVITERYLHKDGESHLHK